SSGSTKTGVGLPSSNLYGRAWKIASVCFGRAQKPPEREGESTQISPMIFGVHSRLVSGSTTARVASGIGQPNEQTRTVCGIDLACFLASSPIANTTISLLFKASLSRSTSVSSLFPWSFWVGTGALPPPSRLLPNPLLLPEFPDF